MDRALQWCREHVAGWGDLGAADLTVETVPGGLTNLLYKCTAARPSAAGFTRVLLRVYAGDAITRMGF
jgi:hypothetical protein